MNTMLMTVFERTHEIGVLLALGWKRRQIVMLVLCEAAILGLLGGLIGVGLGAVTLAILETTPAIRGLLEPDLSWNPRIRVVTNRNDVILNPGDVAFLQRTFGSNLSLHDVGGHLGNLWQPKVQRALMDDLRHIVPVQMPDGN